MSDKELAMEIVREFLHLGRSLDVELYDQEIKRAKVLIVGIRQKVLVDVLEILTHATCERPEGKSWLLGPGEVWAAVRALEETK